MDDERFEYTIRFGRPNLLSEQGMAFRKHEDRWIQSDEFLASVAMHFTRGGVGFNYRVQSYIIDHQPVACGFKDVSILLFRNLIHKALPFAEFNCLKAVDLSQYIFRLGFHFKICQFTILMIHDIQLVLDGVQHLQYACQFMFGKQSNM
jgi:hypothetical protein